jgi:hypothetical protein
VCCAILRSAELKQCKNDYPLGASLCLEVQNKVRPLLIRFGWAHYADLTTGDIRDLTKIGSSGHQQTKIAKARADPLHPRRVHGNYFSPTVYVAELSAEFN